MPTRRSILKAAGGLALVPLLNVPVRAAEKVPLDDPAAKALKYVEDTNEAVGRVDKMGVAAADQLCSNCRFYGEDTDGWGPVPCSSNAWLPDPAGVQAGYRLPDLINFASEVVPQAHIKRVRA